MTPSPLMSQPRRTIVPSSVERSVKVTFWPTSTTVLLMSNAAVGAAAEAVTGSARHPADAARAPATSRVTALVQAPRTPVKIAPARPLGAGRAAPVGIRTFRGRHAAAGPARPGATCGFGAGPAAGDMRLRGRPSRGGGP